MNMDRWVLALSGAAILGSLILARYVNAYWFALTAFMGADLLQASVTRFCLFAAALRKLGVPSGPAF